MAMTDATRQQLRNLAVGLSNEASQLADMKGFSLTVDSVARKFRDVATMIENAIRDADINEQAARDEMAYVIEAETHDANGGIRQLIMYTDGTTCERVWTKEWMQNTDNAEVLRRMYGNSVKR